MMRRRLSALILLASVSILFGLSYGFSEQVVSEEKKSEIQKQEAQEKIIPSAKNIKEKTAIYVFLGWVWLSILVLIYFLRLKIKEVDRLQLFKFFTNEKN